MKIVIKDIGYILEVDVEYPNNLLNLPGDLPFLHEKKKLQNARSLFVIYMTKIAMHIRALKQSLNHKLIKKYIE